EITRRGLRAFKLTARSQDETQSRVLGSRAMPRKCRFGLMTGSLPPNDPWRGEHQNRTLPLSGTSSPFATVVPHRNTGIERRSYLQSDNELPPKTRRQLHPSQQSFFSLACNQIGF